MAAAKKPAASKSASGSKSKAASGSKSNTNKNAAKSPAPKGAKGSAQAAKKSAVQAAREREQRRFWSYILFFAGVLELLVTFIKGDGLWTSLYEVNRGVKGMSVIIPGPKNN